MQVTGLVTIAPSAAELNPAKPSVLAALASEVAGMMRAMRRAGEERRMRQRLAEMPDSLLADIGIAQDEVHRIRMQEKFLPREWLVRQPNLR
jgi:uncharacterized protein YjiS (DUF1127 family)